MPPPKTVQNPKATKSLKKKNNKMHKNNSKIWSLLTVWKGPMGKYLSTRPAFPKVLIFFFRWKRPFGQLKYCLALYNNNTLFKYIHECYIYIHDIFEKKDIVVSLMKDFMVLTGAPGVVQQIRKSERFRFARNHGNRKHKARENNKHPRLQSMAELDEISRVQVRF